MQFYRSGLLISDGTEVPRTIHILKSGVAKVIRKVSENVFVQENFQKCLLEFVLKVLILLIS